MWDPDNRALRYFKRAIRTALGTDHLTAPDLTIASAYIGSDYGGWVVALEPLKEIARPMVLSFGLGDDISFDEEMIRRFNAIVYGFDPTEASLGWIAAKGKPEGMQVLPVGLSHCDGKQLFRLPDSDERGNYSARAGSGRLAECDVSRYSTILERLKINRVDVLKLDIEGSEYGVIPDILASRAPPLQFLIEYHHRLHGIKIEETRQSMKLIRAAGYALFDVSPGGRELSFVRK